MTGKSKEAKVWRVSIGAKIDVGEVQSALGEVSAAVQERALEDIEIHRVDVKEDEVVVFITAKEAAADAFAKTLRVHAPRAEFSLIEAKASEMFKLP